MIYRSLSNEESVDKRIEVRHLFKDAIKKDRDDLLEESTELAKHQVSVVDTAYKSVLCSKNKGYFSTPITTGRHLYDVCKELKIKDLESLNTFRSNKKDFFEMVIKPNIDNSIESAKNISTTYDGVIIAPAIFEANSLRWSQKEYMNLWLNLIDRDVHDIYANNGFAFSDGAVMELTHAALMKMDLSYRDNINLKYINGEDIKYPELINEIITAADEISVFFKPKKQAEAIQKLRIAMILTNCEYVSEKFEDPRIKYNVEAFKYATKWLENHIDLLEDLPSVFFVENDSITLSSNQYKNNMNLVRQNIPEGVKLGC